MKKLLFLLPLIILASCKNNKALPKPFTRAMLLNQVFSIDAAKDTSLETVHGSLIRITAGSFTVTGNVQIEIKEAFTPAEMLAAGLTTESNGKPLRSAGMIYINATSDGKVAGLVKPLKVSVPNNYYDPEMKLFKGVETDSGTINWVDPVMMDTTPQAADWTKGKAIFKSKCSSCHSIFTNRTGPALMEVEYRGPWRNRKKVHEFIQNPARFMAGESYTQRLKAEYGSMMTGFPDLTEDDTHAILEYIKNETVRPGARESEKALYDSLDRAWKVMNSDSDSANNEPVSLLSENMTPPCKDDTVYLALPKQKQSFFETNLPANATPVSPSTESGILENVEDRDIQFTDTNPTSGMYDFEIKTLGWFNIDAAMEGYLGTSNVKIWAQIQVEFEITMHVYLFCPDKQILSVGYEKQGDKYFFNKINGGAPLFLRDRAILFAFGSKGDKMYYGISEFTIQGEQTIQVKVKETTEEEIRSALLSKQMNGIDLGIEKKEQKIIKNHCPDSDEVKKDTALELSPK